MENLLNPDVVLQFIDSDKIDDLMAANGYRFHHYTITHRHASDKLLVERYKGRYGDGYIVHAPNAYSSNCGRITYYVK